MKDVAADHPELATVESKLLMVDTRLRDPEVVLFRAGNLGLGLSEESKRIIIVAYEIVEEGIEPDRVSFWGTFTQMHALIKQARTMVKSGRPICGNCVDAIDREGHFCPRRNGHNH